MEYFLALGEDAFCSYPTYEEWKPFKTRTYSRNCSISSYPTYEEWKPMTNSTQVQAK